MLRKDAWTSDEDKILTDTILDYIRRGEKQLQAFEVVAEKVGRTTSAVGFRWNGFIRQQAQVKDQIDLAKRDRATKRSLKKKVLLDKANEANQSKSLDYESVIRYLKKQGNLMKRYALLQSKIRKVGKELLQLQETNKKLIEELSKTKGDSIQSQEDYHTLLSILDRARHMTALLEQENGMTISS